MQQQLIVAWWVSASVFFVWAAFAEWVQRRWERRKARIEQERTAEAYLEQMMPSIHQTEDLGR